MVSAGSTDIIIEILDENEPEEGEIVDERTMDDTNVYETISSDDEVNLRERIAELEARNLELEKIAMISKYGIEIFFYFYYRIYILHIKYFSILGKLCYS